MRWYVSCLIQRHNKGRGGRSHGRDTGSANQAPHRGLRNMAQLECQLPNPALEWPVALLRHALEENRKALRQLN